jgi:hypothetical protein
MKKRDSGMGGKLCYLSHLSVLIVPRVCYLSHLRVLFVSLSVLIVTLLGKNIRNVCIRKIKSVRKSLSKPDDLRSQVRANLSLTGNHTLPASECREVVV